MGRTAKVQNVLTSSKLIIIVRFRVLGFASGNGHWSHFAEPAVRTSTASLPTQFIVSLLWVMVGYSGWNAATYVAEEVRRPERTLPAALAAGTAIVAVLYLGLNLVFIYATPLEVMKQGAPGDRRRRARRHQPIRAARSGSVRGPVALCIVSTVNAEVTVGPRVYYAMAKNRRFFQSRRHGASALAHSGGGHPESGRCAPW